MSEDREETKRFTLINCADCVFCYLQEFHEEQFVSGFCGLNPPENKHTEYFGEPLRVHGAVCCSKGKYR